MTTSRPSVPLLLALLGSATLGAITLALTTPKTGKEFRVGLRNLCGRFRTRAAEDPDDGDVLAVFI